MPARSSTVSRKKGRCDVRVGRDSLLLDQVEDGNGEEVDGKREDCGYVACCSDGEEGYGSQGRRLTFKRVLESELLHGRHPCQVEEEDVPEKKREGGNVRLKHQAGVEEAGGDEGCVPKVASKCTIWHR